MKTILVLFAFIGLSFGAPKVVPRSLTDDLGDLIAILPIDDIKAVIDDHLQTDGAFVAVVEYLQSDAWKDLVEEVGAKPAVQEFIQYLTDAGFPVEDILDAIRGLIDEAQPGVKSDQQGSLRPILDEIEKLLPASELIDFLNDKLENSPDFRNFYSTISSEKAHNLVEEVRQIEEVQRLAQRLREMGVKLDNTLALVYEFLGWSEPKIKKSARNLSDDLQDFVDLLPLGALRMVIQDHLEQDGELAAALVYFQGQEWRNLVDAAGSKQEVQNLLDYLTDAGFPVKDIIAAIRETVANAKAEAEPEGKGSLHGVLEEMAEQLAGDELLALLDDKLENSKNFQEFYNKISSNDARNLVNKVRQINEVKEVAQALRDYGVKVDEVLARLYGFLGWNDIKVKKSSRGLSDDFEDFIDLLPLGALQMAIQDHLEQDGELAAALVYFQGEEWKNLVDAASSKQEVQDLLDYLTDAGFPIRDIIATIRDTVVNAKAEAEPEGKGSLHGVLEEMAEQLAGDELLALLDDKLQNSKDFQEFYNKISSNDARNLVNKVRQINEVKEVAQALKDYGVKVDEVLARLYGFLGWNDSN